MRRCSFSLPTLSSVCSVLPGFNRLDLEISVQRANGRARKIVAAERLPYKMSQPVCFRLYITFTGLRWLAVVDFKSI